MEKLGVMVVVDSVLYRKTVVTAVENTSLGKVVHTAPNGAIALEWLMLGKIDVVLMDAFVSGSNSLDILAAMKTGNAGVEVVILSDGSPGSAAVTIEALERGAFDFIMGDRKADAVQVVEQMGKQLGIIFAQIKVKHLSVLPSRPDKSGSGGPITGGALSGAADSNKGGLKPGKTFAAKPELVVIASSTGGPVALETVLAQIPENFPKPILVVQHMPPEFTKIFAQTLDKKCRLRVTEAREGEDLSAGRIMIAPGGLHMVLDASPDSSAKSIRLRDTPYVNGVRPAADILFRSVADMFGGKGVLAVVLTGMGNDGMQGVADLKRMCMCYCITQSEKTCVVYGMPRCVDEAGLSDETADIGDIARRVCQIVSSEGL